MSTARLEAGTDGVLMVRGRLDFSSVTALLAQGLDAFGSDRAWVVDLAGVEHANSAGLVLLLEWLDRGRARGLTLCFRNLPEALRAMARMSNVEPLLPTDASD